MCQKNFVIIFFLFVVCSCNSTGGSDSYRQGEPVILKKEYSLIPGICIFTYEGYGKRETFEDKCDKYSVGDKLGENMKDAEQDTLKKETQ
jgi:hypothetical protein